MLKYFLYNFDRRLLIYSHRIRELRERFHRVNHDRLMMMIPDYSYHHFYTIHFRMPSTISD